MSSRRLFLTTLLAAAAALCLHLAVSAALVTPPASAVTASTAVRKAVKYLRSTQTKAGGFTAKGSTPSSITPWVVMAAKAAGQKPASWHRTGGRNPIQYMQTLDIDALATATSPRNPPNCYAKYILAYKAAGYTSLIRRAGKKKIDLVSRLLRYQNASTGRFTTSVGGSGTYASVNTTAYAILALKAADRASSARAKAARWLREQAASNGGFSWNPGSTPDVDSTGAAVQALRAGGVSASSTVIKQALRFLRSKQQRDGGFAYATGGSTVESSALAIQAVVAAGQNPSSTAWRKNGRSPLVYIITRQAKNGSFYHTGRLSASPLLTTSYAVMGLKKRRLPL